MRIITGGPAGQRPQGGSVWVSWKNSKEAVWQEQSERGREWSNEQETVIGTNRVGPRRPWWGLDFVEVCWGTRGGFD